MEIEINTNENNPFKSDPTFGDTNFQKSIETEFYINRNFEQCLERINFEFDKIRSKESNNRHKCFRNPLCNCIYLGKFLVEVLVETADNSLSKQLENYLYCFPIYVPYELFLALINNFLNMMELSMVRVWIEAYLTYTVRDDSKGIQKNKLTLTKKEVNICVN